jgi:hypothetical protein
MAKRLEARALLWRCFSRKGIGRLTQGCEFEALNGRVVDARTREGGALEDLGPDKTLVRKRIESNEQRVTRYR